MRTLAADSQDTKVRQLIEAARAEPVTLHENGEPAAIVLSPTEFDRLDEQDRIRREAKARLRQTIAAIQDEAKKSGLTEAEAERLIPNAKTIAAMKEARRGGHKGYRNVEDLMKSLHEDD